MTRDQHSAGLQPAFDPYPRAQKAYTLEIYRHAKDGTVRLETVPRLSRLDARRRGEAAMDTGALEVRVVERGNITEWHAIKREDGTWNVRDLRPLPALRIVGTEDDPAP